MCVREEVCVWGGGGDVLVCLNLGARGISNVARNWLVLCMCKIINVVRLSVIFCSVVVSL